MKVGFNHNFKYKGVVYHIQTEDGGLRSPNIVTLLYHRGTILASRKTSYADITKADHLAKIVEDLMKEQHKGMLHSLRNGEFDEAIERFAGGRRPSAAEETSASGKSAVAPREAPEPVAAGPQAGVNKAEQAARPAAAESKQPDVAASLDEIVLSYLMGDEK